MSIEMTMEKNQAGKQVRIVLWLRNEISEVLYSLGGQR